MADFMTEHVEGLLEEIRRLRLALELIDRDGCTRNTRGRCWDDPSRQRGAPFSAFAWCDACVARDALGSER